MDPDENSTPADDSSSAKASSPSLDRAAIDRLHSDLVRSEFTASATEALLGPMASAALAREQTVPGLRATKADSSPPALLTRLFLLGVEISVRELSTALGTLGVEGALRLGLVKTSGMAPDDRVRARIDLQPYEAIDHLGTAQWWIASDLGETTTGKALRSDHVLGIGGASNTLAQLTVRTPCESVFDLGTGCGIQALHATRQAPRVVASDLCSRALSYARFNAALAGVDLDLREGSLFAPVAGERFDLVISNPPFVVTPRTLTEPGYTYRDGGMVGDDLVREVFEWAPAHLVDGGLAQFLGNWEHREGVPWIERVQAWAEAAKEHLGGDRLDCWVIEREVQDPAEYAEIWLRDGGLTLDRDPVRYRKHYETYLDDFTQRGVAGVGFGYVLMRRSSATSAPLWRFEEIHGPVEQPLGAEFSAVLVAHDRLDIDRFELLDSRLLRASDVTEERFYTPGDSDPNVVLIRRGGGLHRSIRAGTALAALIGVCDGELTLGQIAAALAGLLDVPLDELQGELVEDARGLVLDGFLTIQ